MIDARDLIRILREASRAISCNGCGFEFMTYPTRNGKAVVREPEAALVITSILSKEGVDFGIEYPTVGKYRISGKNPDRGNTDVLIRPGHERILLELKEGQAQVKSIRKDFLKLRCEPGSGSAFFHVLQNRNKNSIPRLLAKYSEAYDSTSPTSKECPKWFVLFICVRNDRWCTWMYESDITEIEEQTFHSGEFEEDCC